MRNGQSKRMRGRNRKGHNPLTRVYESNGPDVKIRGTPSHIADKYLQLARDAHSSGDPVAAENYFQHAEHYFRLIAGAQEQFRQSQPSYGRSESSESSESGEAREEFVDDGEEETAAQPAGEQPFGTGEPQPYLPRDAQFFPPREGQHGGRPQPGTPAHREDDRDVDRLPSFITGGQPQASASPSPPGNGHDSPERQGDRFPLHRRRRRFRGPRSDMPGSQGTGEADDGSHSSSGE